MAGAPEPDFGSLSDGAGASPASSSSSDAEVPIKGHIAALSSATVSGASGKFLSQELAKWLNSRLDRKKLLNGYSPHDALESVELGVAAVYDGPFGAVFNFIYDVLQFSSGRDKLCALMQGGAKFASAALCRPDSELHWMYRGVEDSLSDGRKIFRLFKEFREVYKVRRGVHRMMEGISESGLVSIPALCGCLDTFGHCASFFYYLLDNALWAASVGILRSKEGPTWQRHRKGHAVPPSKNGIVIARLGGMATVKRRKNLASIWRLFFGFIANVLLLKRAIANLAARDSPFQGPDDPRLFHTLELVGMAANWRILWSRLGYAQLSHVSLGLLAMLASACGIWSNWRKVRRKKCGTKSFVTTLDKRTRRLCMERSSRQTRAMSEL